MKAKIGARMIETLKPGVAAYEVRDTELGGFLIRVQPSGVMTYYCEYRSAENRRNRVKIGRIGVLSIAQARDEALKILGDVAKGQDPAAQKKKDRLLTLNAFLEEEYGPWAKTHLKQGEDTLARIKKRFEQFLWVRLDEITSWKLEKWSTNCRKVGSKGATINRNIGMLKSALSKALEWGLIERNPLTGLKPQKTDSRGKVRFLNQDEEARLLSALDLREKRIRDDRISGNVWRSMRGYDLLPNLAENIFADYLKPMVVVSMHTGLRRGELFGLTWENVSLERKLITLDGQKTKSGQTRHVPMNQTCLETLVKWRNQNDSENYLVFQGEVGKFNNVKRSWTAVLTLAKIVHFRWHDLRHHFASRLVMAGVDLNTVRELLGHSDIKMTLRYAHLAPQIKADAVAKLDCNIEKERRLYVG